MAKPKHDHLILPLLTSEYFVTVSDLCEWTGVPNSTIHTAIRRYESKGLVRVFNRDHRPKPIKVILKAMTRQT